MPCPLLRYYADPELREFNSQNGLPAFRPLWADWTPGEEASLPPTNAWVRSGDGRLRTVLTPETAY